MERDRSGEKYLVNFSFVCRERRVAEAIRLLRMFDPVAFVLEGARTLRFIWGEKRPLEGKEVKGICLRGGEDEVIKTLCTKRIAGFSRLT